MSPSLDEKCVPSDRESLPDDAVPRLYPRIQQAFQEEDAHAGVRVVEAAEKVYGEYSKWFLFIGCVRLCSSCASP